MTNLRYYDLPEHEKQLAREKAQSTHTGKLPSRGATQWLRGDAHERTAAEIAGAVPQRFVARKRYLGKDEVIAGTTELLANGAQKAARDFQRGMPRGAKFLPSDEKPKLLEAYPHLGVCQFADIPINTREGPCQVSLYLANFDAAINMNPDEEFFTIKNHDYAEMYFAVAWKKDDTGEYTLAMNVGNKGLMFKTNERSKAFDNAVHLATGIPASKWQERMKAASERLFEINKATAGMPVKAM